MRFRRFKLPVFSRLTLAWFAFASIGAGATIVALSDNGRRAAIAKAVAGVEHIAPPASRLERQPQSDSTRTSAGEALSATTASEEAGEETTDSLASLTDNTAEPDSPSADVVITVDGAPARAIGAEPDSRIASLQQVSVAAPSDNLLRRSVYGKIPRIGSKGERPAKFYARPFAPDGSPVVALIIGGLGLNRAITERAIDELPPEITLAFAPYSKDLIFWTKRARDAGHEIMIEIPMENRKGDAETIGAAALLTSRKPQENALRLDWILSRFEGYFGVTNYLGARFTGDRDAMDAVLDVIKGAGLAYVDDTGLLRRSGADADVATVNLLINPGYGSDRAETARDLEGLEKIATREGSALGKTYVNDSTLNDIVSWAKDLDSHDITLAPASAVISGAAVDQKTATR